MPVNAEVLVFVLSALATWRVTHLLAHEDGPGEAFVWLRVRAGRLGLGQLLDCFNCLSMWVAIPFAVWLADGAFNIVRTWLALSGAACLLQRVGHQPLQIHPISDTVAGGSGGDHELLRTQARGRDESDG